MSAFEPVLDALLRASLYGGLFIAAVWAVCRLFPRLPASVRCGLWWAACLKLVLDLVWIAPVPVALLPAETTAAAPVVEAASLYIRNAAAPRTLTPNQLIPSGSDPSLPPSPGEGRSLSWESALVAAWLLGLLGLSAKVILGLRQTRRILRSSEPLREGWVRAAFLDLCERLSLRRAPELRGSGEVGTPQVTGLLRPVVLIPEAGFTRLSAAEVSMTLCHELVHLRRRDLWLGWVPALAQRLFFFHPLAALAAREYALAREAACDAEVLRVLGSAPQAYGRLLLRWGVAPRETGLAAAGASPSVQNLKRRLQMLQQTSDNKKRSAAWLWLAGAVVLVGLVPIQIVAQEEAPSAAEGLAPAAAVEPVLAEAPEAAPAEPAEPAEPGEPAEPLPGTPVAIAHAPTPLPPGAPAPARAPRVPQAARPVTPVPPVPGTPAVAPVPPVPRAHPAPARAPKAVPGAHPRPALAPAPPVAMAHAMPAPAPRAVVAREAGKAMTPPPAPPAPPKPPVPPKPPKEGQHGYSYSYNDNGDSWIVMKGEGNTIMNGSSRDIRHVKELRRGGEDIFWFRRDGKEYVVRDAATLAQVEKIWEPLGRLGAKQGELGAEQGKLGGKQGALGAKQGALGARQGALAAERATRRGNEADEREIERRQREIEEDMDQLSREMEDLGGEMEALGRQMEEMGRQMEAASARAEKEMQTLMAQAVRNGAAQEVR